MPFKKILFLKNGWVSFVFLVFIFQSCEKSESYQVLDTPFKVLDSYGQKRIYRIYFPKIKKNKLPLLVYFHGVRSEGFKDIPTLQNYTGSPVEETGLIGFCRIKGIVLLVPEPAYTYMFLGKRSRGWLPFEKEMNGIEKLIDLVVEKYPINRGNIYLAGISAGAGFCHHLANHRPEFYSAILSHSQGFLDEKGDILNPRHPGPKFGVLFCYTRGDYQNLIKIATLSEEKYRSSGYKTALLKNLPPLNHSWSKESNSRFWRYLQQLSR